MINILMKLKRVILLYKYGKKGTNVQTIRNSHYLENSDFQIYEREAHMSECAKPRAPFRVVDTILRIG